MQTCPKCRYVRKPTDTAPDWQCPSCGIAYAKFGNSVVHSAHHPIDHPLAVSSGDDEVAEPQTTAQQVRTALLDGVLAFGTFAFGFAGLTHVIPLARVAEAFYVLPWLAIALVAVFSQWFTYQWTNLDYQIFGKKPDQATRKHFPKKASVSLLIFVPAIALFYLSTPLFAPDRSAVLSIYSLTGGATMVAVAFATCPSLRKHWFTGVWMFPVACFYSMGTAVGINGRYDRTQPAVIVIEIEEKYESRRGRHSYDLNFLVHDVDAPLRPYEVNVSQSLYRMKERGDQVCRFERSGFLRMPWSQVSECPN